MNYSVKLTYLEPNFYNRKGVDQGGMWKELPHWMFFSHERYF